MDREAGIFADPAGSIASTTGPVFSLARPVARDALATAPPGNHPGRRLRARAGLRRQARRGDLCHPAVRGRRRGLLQRCQGAYGATSVATPTTVKFSLACNCSWPRPPRRPATSRPCITAWCRWKARWRTCRGASTPICPRPTLIRCWKRLRPAASQGVVDMYMRVAGRKLTLRDMALRHGQSVGFPQIVGTPAQVADQLEAYYQQAGGDGFMLTMAYAPGPSRNSSPWSCRCSSSAAS